MNIIFKTLHIEHFLSFGVVDIDLQQPGYTLVSGRNENPNDKVITKEEYNKMSYKERLKLFNENQEAFQELTKSNE